jgi:hypothetical protein
MIVSHTYKYIFIHVSKTAGSSIQKLLHRHNNKKDICIGIPGNGAIVGMNDHATIEQVRNAYPREYDEYFKFAFVRNPWDRMVSSYCFRNRKRIDWKNDFSFIRKGFIKETNSIGSSFFLERPHLMHPFDTISIDGVVRMDVVYRFETLHEDIKDICWRLGVSDNGAMPMEMTKMRKDRRHYSYWYNDSARERVASFFPRMIEMFGYEFEEKK